MSDEAPLPRRLEIHSSAFYLDGGTTCLRARDEVGQPHTIILIQHLFPESASDEYQWVPGRLQYDQQLIEVRSEREAYVIQLLRNAKFVHGPAESRSGEPLNLSSNAMILGDDIRDVLLLGPEDNLRHLTQSIIRFVESDQYVEFAKRVKVAAEQKADSASYDAWIAWTPKNRKQVLVRLARVRNIGLQQAAELLDRDGPIASDLSALEVSDLRRIYAKDGLSLRIEPEFRW